MGQYFLLLRARTYQIIFGRAGRISESKRYESVINECSCMLCRPDSLFGAQPERKFHMTSVQVALDEAQLQKAHRTVLPASFSMSSVRWWQTVGGKQRACRGEESKKKVIHHACVKNLLPFCSTINRICADSADVSRPVERCSTCEFPARIWNLWYKSSNRGKKLNRCRCWLDQGLRSAWSMEGSTARKWPQTDHVFPKIQ